MSLYLCVFAEEREVAGIDVGSYADFNALRRHVCATCEGGSPGRRFPILNGHSDCEGAWTAAECAALRDEIAAILAELGRQPPPGFPSESQRRLARSRGFTPRHAAESFLDAEGECLLPRLLRLAETALALGEPILFQ